MCAIGHNLIGKVKNRKELLGIATNVFRVIDHGATSCVTSYKSFGQTPYEFTFTLNDRNLPQEIVAAPQRISPSQDYIDTNTLQDIFSAIIPDGKTITPDKLMAEVSEHLVQMTRSNRARNFISNALIRGLITRDTTTGEYSATPAMHKIPDPRSSCFFDRERPSQPSTPKPFGNRLLRPHPNPQQTPKNHNF